MPQSVANVEFNTFVAGLITEASPLNFPENASLDEQNMVLNREGSRQRRLGIDYESGYSFTDTGVVNNTFQTGLYRTSFYRWDNVDNDPTISLGIVQVGTNLWLIDLYASSPSANLKNSGASFTISGMTASTVVDFSPIGGKLVAAYGANRVAIISYDSDTDTVSVERKTIDVRDIWGIDDGLDIDENPGTLSDDHEYNLYNQGWPTYKVEKSKGSGSEYPHLFYEDEEGAYPDNSQIWYYGVKSNSDGDTVFDPELMRFGKWFGNTRAPRGHYIIDLFDRSGSRGSKNLVGTVATDITIGGFSTVASYAGRVFYSGINVTEVQGGDDQTPRLETMIVFSQVVDNDDKINKCYQEADPTAEDINDIIATDGGTISIPEVSRVFKLVTVGKSLIVIAENGIWSISGSDEGFSATNFQVDKISNVGALGPEAVVVAEGNVFYWSKAGIYQLSPDQITGTLAPTNISETTIQTFFSGVPSIGRTYAKGTYDEAARKIRWLYNDEDSYDGTAYVDRFNAELVLDLTLGAFYKNKFPSSVSTPSAIDYVSTPNYLVSDVTENVFENGVQVTVNGDNVNIVTPVRSRGTSTTKYLTMRPGSTNMEFSLSQYRNADFLDWYTEDTTGSDAEAFVETGYFTGGDSQRSKSSKYITVHCKRTEEGYVVDGNGNLDFDSPSSCLMQARWGFTDSSNSGKWSSQQQVYRLNRLYLPSGVSDTFDYGYNVVTTKNKIRGHGESIRVRFSSEAGKDLYIYGWGMPVAQENDV